MDIARQSYDGYAGPTGWILLVSHMTDMQGLPDGYCSSVI
jgi:hypothetical protein